MTAAMDYERAISQHGNLLRETGEKSGGLSLFT